MFDAWCAKDTYYAMLRLISLVTAGAFLLLAFHALSADHAGTDNRAVAEQGNRSVDEPSDRAPSRDDSDSHQHDSLSLLTRANCSVPESSGILSVEYLVHLGITQDSFSATDFSLPDRPNPNASILRTRSLRL